MPIPAEIEAARAGLRVLLKIAKAIKADRDDPDDEISPEVFLASLREPAPDVVNVAPAMRSLREELVLVWVTRKLDNIGVIDPNPGELADQAANFANAVIAKLEEKP